MSNTGEALSIRASEYDIPRLSTELKVGGYELEYLPETASTMDDAKDFGLRKTVVLADYQTAGRGRYGRTWEAELGKSVLMTIVEPYYEAAGDPPIDSILPTQVSTVDVCIGLQEATGSKDIKVRWFNDLVAHGQKIGGLLIENTRYSGPDVPYPKLFGIGINVHYLDTNQVFPDTDYGAISLDEIMVTKEFERTDVVLAVMKQWVASRVDMRVMRNNSNVFNYHDNRLKENANLIGQIVRISGLGPKQDEILEGTVLRTPLDHGLFLDVDGTEIEITEYNSKTKVEVL